MEINKTKNATRSFLFGLVFKLLTIIGPFIIRTIIIYRLGNDYLGLNSLFTSVLTILNISELGIGSAITFCLYKPVAENDEQRICALLSLLRKLYRWIGLAILIIGMSFLPFLKYIIKGDYPEINIYVLYMIYLLNSVVSYLGFAYKAVLFNVYQRVDITHKINSIVEIIKYVFQAIVLLVLKNYYLYLLVLLISTVIVNILNQIISRKMYPHLVPNGEVSIETKKIIKNKVLSMSAYSIASAIINSVDNIVLSSTMGLVITGIYGNYSYIYTALFSIILIGYNALTPAVGNSLCTKSKDENRNLFNAVFLGANWIAAWFAICLLCLYQPFIEIWVGKSGLLSFWTVIMIVIYFYSNAARQIVGVFINASGLWNKILLRVYVAAACNLILDIVLVNKYSVAGIVFASFFTNAFISFPMDIKVVYKNILDEKYSYGIIKALILFAVEATVGGLTYFVCSLVSLNGILDLVIKLVLCILIPNVIFYLLLNKNKDFIFVKKRIVGIIKKR